MTEQTNHVKEMVKKFSQADLLNDVVANSSEGSDDVSTKLETRGRKKKYQNDTDRLNARKEQQKRYRDRQKEKVKELLALIEGLNADDITELKNKAEELRAAKNIVDE